jgi:gluconokinase
MSNAPAVVVMGVSGSGKTTIGRRLAAQLGWMFLDGDDFHPAANIEKMRAGMALTDEDREPWLAALRAEIDIRLAAGEPCVIACSALRRDYRRRLRAPGVRFLYLRTEPVLARQRLAHRERHFFNERLLDSQYEILEEPRDAVVVSASLPPDMIVEHAIRQLEGTS